MDDLSHIYHQLGFTESPFNQTPDTNFLYTGRQHMKALNHLQYGLMIDGFTLLIGEIGLGKTILCRQLLKTAGKGVRTVYIYNTYINLIDLLKAIYYDLTGVALESDTYSKCFNAINISLIRAAKNGEKVVVVIDEAQSLNPNVLEGLRQLSNLETEKRKLLSFIMVGQPELAERLARSSLRQLDQRISVRHYLKPLGLSDTRKYINHRLYLATNSAKSILTPYFSDFAIYLVYKYSKGAPRRINQICDRALLASFNAGKSKIGIGMLRKAAREILM